MRNVILLGLVSFFSDVSTEMVYPLIPLYLTGVFGATPALVGLIEGIAESLASLLKVFSGFLTDKYRRKKPIAFFGYATGLLYKGALLVAGSWGGVLLARVVDRIGKGVRTAPRDVLVSESADKGSLGFAFGIHKALDMAGSALGILLAYLLMTSAHGEFEYKKLFLLSMIPAAIGLGMLFAVRERTAPRVSRKREPFWRGMRALDGNLKLYLLVAFVFTLGNSSNTFLLLRAKDIGFTDRNVVLLYLGYNLAAALLAVPCGRLSDRIGRKRLLVGGYVAFAAVYFGFAFVRSAGGVVAVFLLYGLYAAMTAGVERAFIAEIAPEHLRGTMLGLHSTIVGVALLPASTIAGLMWNVFGARAPFVLGASLSLLAALILSLLLGKKHAPAGQTDA